MSNKFQNALEKYQKQVTVKTLDGEKLYTFRLLRQKEAAKIYHKTVSVLLSALAQAAGGDGPASKLEAIKAVDFETFWTLASTLLKSCDIRPNPQGNPDYFITVKDLDTCEYFDDAREELYIAVYYALQANYPKSWARVEKAMGDIGPRIEAMMDPTSGTALTPDSSEPATSPSSTGAAPSKSGKRGRTLNT